MGSGHCRVDFTEQLMTRPLTSFKMTVGWGHPKDKIPVCFMVLCRKSHTVTPVPPPGTRWLVRRGQRTTQSPRGSDHQGSSQSLAASGSKKQQVCRRMPDAPNVQKEMWISFAVWGSVSRGYTEGKPKPKQEAITVSRQGERLSEKGVTAIPVGWEGPQEGKDITGQRTSLNLKRKAQH